MCWLVLLISFLLSVGVIAQNVAINADGSDPNANAALDVSSPSTGDGKGLLIPRVTNAQRTTASAAEAGGLLDDSGDLRGGAAQGLLVYQTDGNQGFYYNTSTTATPSWLFLCEGDAGSGLLSHERGGLEADVSAYDGLVKISGGVTSAFTFATPLPGSTITIGNSATTSNNGVAVGVLANGDNVGVAIGYQANGATSGLAVGYRSNARYYGVAVGRQANGFDCNVAVGYYANAFTGYGPYAGGVAIGYRANSFSGDGKYTGGVAIGYRANARHNFNENDSGAVTIGFMSNSFIRGVGVGYKSAGYNQGVAVGYLATGSNAGVGIGYKANGYTNGTAIGYMANSGNRNYSFAKGAYSRCTRRNEEWKASDGYNNKYGYGQVNWHGYTTTASLTEIFLGGTGNQRFTLQDNSAVGFQIIVTGVNTDTGDTSFWRCWGGIERRLGANTSALVGAVTIDAKTQGGLTNNPTITADTTYGSLKLQVTGVVGNTVRWNAMMMYSEVRQ